MPFARLIPCLDVAAGRVVKGVNFLNLRDMGDPTAMAAHYSAEGADELVFLDITATVEARSTMIRVVEDVAENIAIPLTVGGAVRSVDDGAALLSAGADKVAVNTAAVANPDLITDLATRCGSQAVVVAIDAKGGRVVTHAGRQETNLDAVEWAAKAESLGAGELLVTSMDRDGTRQGYDLNLTKAIAGAVSIPVIASGGAGTARDVADALGVTGAALVASLVHEAADALSRLRAELALLGVELRHV